MFEQSRWPIWAWIEILAGCAWLVAASSVFWVGAMPAFTVGGILLAAGCSHLLWPGDRRVSKFAALTGFVGALIALPYGFALGGAGSIALFGTALAAVWAAGRISIQLEPHILDAPVPVATAAMSAKVALDELVLGFEQFQTSGYALDGTVERVIDEVREARVRFEAEGFLEKPDTYHTTPPDLLDPTISYAQTRGHRVERLRFDSGYAPRAGEPGRERWLGYPPCHEGRAYALRHPGPPRPWLICTNGYRMGNLGIDVRVFERFFVENGLNVLVPVLPLHGARRLGWHSGTGFLGLDVIDTLHATAQSIWDLRRLLSWVRAQEAPAIGAFGLSLGGYVTALFASVAEGLDSVVCGIPLADIPRLVERHADPHQFRYAQHLGFDVGEIGQIMRVVSPLALEPKVERTGRLIFAANADRLVTPDQVVDLWRHWEKPEIVWYQGSHLSFMREREVWNAVDRKLQETGVAIRGCGGLPPA